MFSSHAFNVLIAFDLIYLLAKFKFEDLQSVKNAKLYSGVQRFYESRHKCGDRGAIVATFVKEKKQWPNFLSYFGFNLSKN